MIKKWNCSLFCMAIMLMVLSGCGSSTNGQSTGTADWEPTNYETVNNFDGVTMTIKEGTVSSTGLTVMFENASDKQGTYGDHFWLEKKIEGNWLQVPVIIDDYGFNDIGYELAPSETETFTVDWEWLYGSLETGEYRIIKDILDFRGTGDYDKYYLAAPFTID